MTTLPLPPIAPAAGDPATVRWLAACATVAYASQATITAAATGAGLATTWIDHRLPSTQVWIGRGPLTVVAFRGTDDAPDWVTDAWAAKTRPAWLPSAQVHRGFLSALNAVDERIDAVVGAEPVWLCGHSLGGALATLYAARRVAMGLTVSGVVTLGQPRVGTAGFAALYQPRLGGRHVRVQNLGDPVPRVPPSELGWQHVGTRWMLDTHGKLVADVGWFTQFFDRWFGGDKRSSAREAASQMLGEHACAEYLRRLALVQ
jgi:triacylglycerol lipase